MRYEPLNRLPSAKTLKAAFGREKGLKLRKALESSAYRSNFLVLRDCDAILETHGCEFIPQGHNQKSPSIEYCNTGETYATTLLLIDGMTFRVGNWGDYVERGNYD